MSAVAEILPEPQSPPAGLHAGAVLTVDLAAISDNWRLLKGRHKAGRMAAVVKADAYGLGAAPVGKALFEAGCRDFFVAHLGEGIALRPHLPDAAAIHVLNGLMPGAEAECLAHGLIPVLNSLEQVEAWASLGRVKGRALPAVLQVDSGMARLGMAPIEVERLAANPLLLRGIEVQLVMSHLACADEPDHPANAAQLAEFERLRRLLPAAPASFANSSGMFLGPDYQFDLGRPGAALYGIAPVPGRPNPLKPVVRLDARIIQTRSIAPGTAVGYGHSFAAAGPTRIATISVGYADGWLRALSNAGHAYFGDVALPIAGRVSMDSITLDVTQVPSGILVPGAMVELIGPHQTIDQVAAAAGTIGYEILTSLGARYHRHYLGA